MISPLVDAAWLLDHLGHDDVVPADVRWYLDGRSGRAAHLDGHIPGSVFVDVDGVLAAPPGDGPGRHPLPSPHAFAAAMTALGIGDDSVVVAYDDAAGSVAARLWWMLDAQGKRVHVLDGGLAAWLAAGGRLETGEAPPRPPRRFSARPWPAARLADAEHVDRAVRSGAVVLDARAPERYRGEVEPVDPRAGHVPGARSAAWSGNLDGATSRFLPADALRRRYAELGVAAGDDGATAGEVIVYCGSGITACHDLLALRVAGVSQARLYEGSWSDWCSDPQRPVRSCTGTAAT